MLSIWQQHKEPCAQLGRNMGPTVQQGQDPRTLVLALHSRRETCKQACSQRQRWAAWRALAVPSMWGQQAFPLHTGPEWHVNMSARPFSPHPWEKDDSEPASSGLCWGPMAPPVTSPSVPSILSPLTRGRSQEALASPEAWRMVARVLSCKHVRLGYSKMPWQCGSKAVRSTW